MHSKLYLWSAKVLLEPNVEFNNKMAVCFSAEFHIGHDNGFVAYVKRKLLLEIFWLLKGFT